MNKNLTEIVYILDRSGSMSGLEKDTIGGYNSFLEKQKHETGEAVVTTVLFDDKYDIIHDRVDIKKIKPLTSKEYYARGMTALLDAIGKTINHIGGRHKNALDSEVPEKTIVVITTDGLENASCEFSLKKVKTMIERQKKKYGWEFIFLGANIDAIDVAKGVGIDEDRAATYYADDVGTEINFRAIGNVVSHIRGKRLFPDAADWKEDIEEYTESMEW